MTAAHRLATSVIGSYPQPDWLIDRGALGSDSVPRVRVSDAWRVAVRWRAPVEVRDVEFLRAHTRCTCASATRRSSAPRTANRYEFLGELADSSAQQISVEAAQPQLDLGQLSELAPKTVLVGVLDLGDREAETAEMVAERIRAALAHVPAERLVPAPDCGMKYLPRPLAFAKLRALSQGAARVRAEL